MPWCDGCSRFYTPSTLSAGGDCPAGHHVAEPTESAVGTDPADPEVEKVKAPWHFWFLVVAVVIYLGWRVIQGIGLLL